MTARGLRSTEIPERSVPQRAGGRPAEEQPHTLDGGCCFGRPIRTNRTSSGAKIPGMGLLRRRITRGLGLAAGSVGGWRKVLLQERANWSRRGLARGATLVITEGHVVFQPNSMEAFLGLDQQCGGGRRSGEWTSHLGAGTRSQELCVADSGSSSSTAPKRFSSSLTQTPRHSSLLLPPSQLGKRKPTVSLT